MKRKVSISANTAKRLIISRRNHEENRSHYSAAQARRRENRAEEYRRGRNDHSGSAGTWPAEGPQGNLSRHGVRGGSSAEDQDRAGGAIFTRRRSSTDHSQQRADRPHRRREDFCVRRGGSDTHPQR